MFGLLSQTSWFGVKSNIFFQQTAGSWKALREQPGPGDPAWLGVKQEQWRNFFPLSFCGMADCCSLSPCRPGRATVTKSVLEEGRRHVGNGTTPGGTRGTFWLHVFCSCSFLEELASVAKLGAIKSHLGSVGPSLSRVLEKIPLIFPRALLIPSNGCSLLK